MNGMVTWDQGLSFIATTESGYRITLGTGADGGSKNENIVPLELMAISLAGCTAMDVISILEKKQQAVSAFEVKVQTDRADQHPKVFTHAVITYKITGHAVDETAVVRAIELSSTKYCPAQAMLGKVMPIELVYEIYEGSSANGIQLVKKGKYQPAVAIG